jgi:hypothetical protein
VVLASALKTVLMYSWEQTGILRKIQGELDPISHIAEQQMRASKKEKVEKLRRRPLERAFKTWFAASHAGSDTRSTISARESGFMAMSHLDEGLSMVLPPF